MKPDGLKSLPIDHQVRPSQRYQGGSHEAQQLWHKFLHQRLAQYDQNRNEPDEDGSSGLSPHLHFGQISAHQVVHELLSNDGWTPDRASKPNGKNHDFWNLSPSAEAFMDQMLTWREMGFNMTHREPDRYDRYDSLPDWAQKSLKQHTRDPRPRVYELEQFERAETGDELWNAAQRELVQTGKMHNYLRMLWGKLFLQWTATPQDSAVHDRAEQQVCLGWSRSEFLQRHLLDTGALRPCLGSNSPYLWKRPVHDQRQHASQAEVEAVPEDLWAK